MNNYVLIANAFPFQCRHGAAQWTAPRWVRARLPSPILSLTRKEKLCQKFLRRLSWIISSFAAAGDVLGSGAVMRTSKVDAWEKHRMGYLGCGSTKPLPGSSYFPAR